MSTPKIVKLRYVIYKKRSLQLQKVMLKLTYKQKEIKMQTKIVDININTFEGVIEGNLIVYEKNGDPDEGFWLSGFDEVGMFDDEFTAPQYALEMQVSKYGMNVA